MLNGRILPWVQDDSSDDYPVWSEYEANQRDVFFINNEGFIDTSFSITPYSPSSIEDVQYIKNIILEIKNEDITDNVHIICPSNTYSNNLFDVNKQTVILIKRNNLNQDNKNIIEKTVKSFQEKN